VRAVLIAVAGGATMQAAAAEAGADAATPVIDQRRIGQLLELQDEQQPALVADIIALFLADSPRHLETLAAAIRDGDAAQLESTAHRYLSGIENLGARRMQVHCMELERLARAGAIDAAAAVLEQLASEFGQAREPLAAIAKKYQ
jgi:HPt (histidine-containing phosphotransfer) domain-containing protein